MEDIVSVASLSFILTVAGFLIQVFDVFPRHRELRRDILIATFGIFVGSLLASVTGVTVSLKGEGLSLAIALGFGLLSLAFLLAAVVAPAQSRKNEMYTIAGVGLALFLAFLIFPALEAPGSAQDELVLGERLAVARYNVAAGQTERAIDHLDRAQGLLPVDDPRAEPLRAEVEKLKEQQFQKESDAINETQSH